MKKVLYTFAIAAVMMSVACAGASTEETVVDSVVAEPVVTETVTAPVVDSAKTDSTVVAQ